MKRGGFPLFFNHVPKCVGTSLNEVISRDAWKPTSHGWISKFPGTVARASEVVVWCAPTELRRSVKLALNGSPIDVFDPQRGIVDRSQIWSSVDIDAATIGDGRCRLEIDRRNAPAPVEFWLLDLVFRAAAERPAA